MKKIVLYKLENWIEISEKPERAVIYGSPCDALLELQKKGYCVLAELSHLQGLSEQEQADALCAEAAAEQYHNVCICAKELPQSYLRRIWCRWAGQPVLIAETKRLLIRESIPEDAKAFGSLYQDEACKRFLESIPAECDKSEEPESQHKALVRYIQDYAKGQYAFYEYGMWTVLEKNGAVIGRMGLEQIADEEGEKESDTSATLYLGYALLPEYRGFGFALEACLAILSYCQECGYADRIRIKIDRKNAKSIALAKRLQAKSPKGIVIQIDIK